MREIFSCELHYICKILLFLFFPVILFAQSAQVINSSMNIAVVDFSIDNSINNNNLGLGTANLLASTLKTQAFYTVTERLALDKVVGRQDPEMAGWIDKDTAAHVGLLYGVQGIDDISYGAFYQCYSLTGMIIPSSVNNIGSLAFNSCVNLASVSFEGSNCTIADSSVFANDGSNILCRKRNYIYR